MSSAVVVVAVVFAVVVLAVLLHFSYEAREQASNECLNDGEAIIIELSQF